MLIKRCTLEHIACATCTCAAYICATCATCTCATCTCATCTCATCTISTLEKRWCHLHGQQAPFEPVHIRPRGWRILLCLSIRDQGEVAHTQLLMRPVAPSGDHSASRFWPFAVVGPHCPANYIRATCIVMVAGCGLAVTTQADAQFPGHASVSAEDHQHTDTSRK